jgi:hypothetical protein
MSQRSAQAKRDPVSKILKIEIKLKGDRMLA